MTSRCLSWLHVGDLHARAEDDWTGVDRLGALLDEVSGPLRPGDIDFVFLPGDNANEGEPEQYARIAEAIAARPPLAPWRVIPGDHDFVPGKLRNFNTFLGSLGAPELPAAVEMKGRRALFLDVVSAGGGGPEFDLGRAQSLWLKRQLDIARREDPLPPVVFMHTFPGDLSYDGPTVARLFAEAGVALVDTGHTHYNEVINDGAVIYAAARSTAQIEEEGEAAFGAAFLAVDGDQASFRFRRARSGWPFVLITSPADHRLQIRPTPLNPEGRLTVRAKVFGGGDEVRVSLRGLGRNLPMTPVADETAMWAATFEEPWRDLLAGLPREARRVSLTVVAESAEGVGEDTIRLGPKIPAPPVGWAGSVGGSIGAWPEHGLLATRLGPNAYGREP